MRQGMASIESLTCLVTLWLSALLSLENKLLIVSYRVSHRVKGLIYHVFIASLPPQRMSNVRVKDKEELGQQVRNTIALFRQAEVKKSVTSSRYARKSSRNLASIARVAE